MANATGNPGIKSHYSPSGGRLIFERANASTGVEWGSDGSGIDMSLWGETAGAKLHWIASSDSLVITSADVTFTGNDFSMSSASAAHFTAVRADVGSASFAGNIVCAGSTTLTFGAGTNIVLSSVSGSVFGTSSTQKIGFLGAAPIIAEKFSVSAADIASAMRNFGLMTTTSA